MGSVPQCGQGAKLGQGAKPLLVAGLGRKPHKLVVCYVTKIAFVMQKCTLMLSFCLKFIRTHNTVSHAKTAQSSEPSQHVKQTV